ncbi:hypothetical protein PHET_12240 [Paragonimus heterotremus]|uniref:Uncharacterized protein n=1 Tax=Paragonimus heterotremus TaxID=100268 RepID=A0A8J4SYY2_9TREM|nr:hypothetical protein PHET_12240 [Paragonimus heterotremus]
MTLHDVQCVLDALKYGGELESRVVSELGACSSESAASANMHYRLSPQPASTAGLAHLPCTVCMVSFLWLLVQKTGLIGFESYGVFTFPTYSHLKPVLVDHKAYKEDHLVTSML